jgi:DNA-binding MarR family transcriptional regulator
VIVYQGPVSLKDLAAAEQVTPPTMSRIVRLLEGVGLVQRLVDPNDRRALGLLATAEGRRVLQEGRGERLRILAKGLDRLSSSEKQVVSGAISILERILVKP